MISNKDKMIAQVFTDPNVEQIIWQLLIVKRTTPLQALPSYSRMEK